MKVMKFPYLVVVLILLAACGESSSDQSPSVPIIEIVPKGQPANYQLYDANCQNQNTTIALTNADLPTWSGTSLLTETVDLAGLVTRRSLQSPAVSETIAGSIFARSCQWDQNRPATCVNTRGDEKGWTQTDSGKPLRVCLPGQTYPRDSLEGVALTSVQYLTQAHALFASVQSAVQAAGDTVPQVDVQILPQFISTYDGYQENGVDKKLRLWITRNLAYFPAQSGLAKPMIVVWPEPQKLDNSATEWLGGLWESGFVLAHEFGHHIEHGVIANARKSALTFNDRSQDTLIWDPIYHSYFDVSPAGEANGGVTPRSQSHKAVSESFADLVGYVTDGMSARGISGIPCFGFNRALDRATFKDGSNKILTTEVIDRLFAGSRPSGCAEAPEFGDGHIVGAVIAHGTYALLKNLLGEERPDAKEAYTAILRWLIAIRNSPRFTATVSDDPAGPLASLREGVEALAAPYLDETQHQPDVVADRKASLCADFSTYFPAIVPPVFATPEGNCPASRSIER